MGSLLKFGAKVHLEQFLEEGLLYMNTLKWFSEAEDRARQHDDSDDQFVARWRGTVVTLHFGQFAIDDSLSVRMRSNERQRINIFCMYLYGRKSAWVDPKNHRKNEMCAVIYDRAAFMERVLAAFEAQSQFNRLEAGSVRYLDPEARHDEVNPFEKALCFSYQHEFRIALSPGLADPCLFRIGDLTDIGFLMHADAVNRIPMHENLLPPKRE